MVAKVTGINIGEVKQFQIKIFSTNPGLLFITSFFCQSILLTTQRENSYIKKQLSVGIFSNTQFKYEIRYALYEENVAF
jgi:hypothetical protein